MNKIHSNIYFLCLISLAAALPLSLFFTTGAQFCLLINWLWEGNLKDKLKRFVNNKPALILSSLYFLHILGLLYTTDFDYGFKDLRVKVPLLMLPLIISTSSPLNQKQFFRVLVSFICGVVLGTFISLYVIVFKNLTDIRQASMFISHIRFSLLIDIAIFCCFYFSFQQSENSIQKQLTVNTKSLLLVLAAWLIIFLFIFESMTGLTILFTCLIIYTLYLITRNSTITSHRVIKYVLLAFTLLILTFSFINIRDIYREVYSINKVDIKKLDQYTSLGNKYEHDTISKYTENGNYLGLYICEKELRDSWNNRSKLKYDSTDLKGQQLSSTLKRFLTSKGLRKDANGVNKLTDIEIHSIESGDANVNYQGKTNIRARIQQVIWEYKTYSESGHINTSSVMQRYEFWRASLGLIKKHFWLGVGTGDMNKAFKEQYLKMKTSLDIKNQWRSHNQYLSIFVGFGVFGFVWFLLILFYPFYYSLRSSLITHRFLYIAFFLTAILSMLSEDTIESQTGVTFFAFFSSFFLFGNKTTTET